MHVKVKRIPTFSALLELSEYFNANNGSVNFHIGSLVHYYDQYDGDILSLINDKENWHIAKNARFLYWRNHPETPLKDIKSGLSRYEEIRVSKFIEKFPDLVFTDESLAQINYDRTGFEYVLQLRNNFVGDKYPKTTIELI
ncbi:MAG: hypothetical protein IPP04_06975 [Saprospiraceae bacterium]|nr:hypothetical protein [Saprospiraceae bacterium]